MAERGKDELLKKCEQENFEFYENQKKFIISMRHHGPGIILILFGIILIKLGIVGGIFFGFIIFTIITIIGGSLLIFVGYKWYNWWE
jgi:hypothetical protein